MKLGFRLWCWTKAQSSQLVSKVSPNPKWHCKFRPMWKWCWLCVLIRGHNSSWISTSWSKDKEYYLRVMKRLREAVRRKRPDLWRGKKLLHHYDNALVKLSNLICGFVTKHETMLVLDPPYLPDLALEDFFLFTKLKSVLKGQWFEFVEGIKENLLAELRSVPNEAFKECFQNKKKFWEQCIKRWGEYFKGDKAQ